MEVHQSPAQHYYHFSSREARLSIMITFEFCFCLLCMIFQLRICSISKGRKTLLWFGPKIQALAALNANLAPIQQGLDWEGQLYKTAEYNRCQFKGRLEECSVKMSMLVLKKKKRRACLLAHDMRMTSPSMWGIKDRGGGWGGFWVSPSLETYFFLWEGHPNTTWIRGVS